MEFATLPSTIMFVLLRFLSSTGYSGAESIASAPTLFWASHPVGPNQTLLVAGASIPRGATVLLEGGGSEAEPVSVPVSQSTAASVKFTIPANLALSSYSVRVCNATVGGCSDALRVNEATPWWVAGDAGNQSTSGGWVRVFGTCLSFANYDAPVPHGVARQLEERLRHALRSRDADSIARLSTELASTLRGGGSATASQTQMRLTSTDGSAVILSATNASLWDATFTLPLSLAPGEYAVSVRNELQPSWTDLNTYGGRAHPNVRSIEVAAPVPEGKTFEVADYFSQFGIPAGGLDFKSGSPVNGTAAVIKALADAEAAGGGVVLLPIGKLFVDGALRIPPHTTLRGTSQELSTLYFMEDGIGRQLGGEPLSEGGSPAPDPAYIFCNCTEPWGIEHLSIYVTHFSNTVVWLPPGGVGFKMRHVLVREVPYFCGGYGQIIPGGGNGVGKGAVPPDGQRDEATTSALKGHANRIANWTAGALNIGPTIMFEGNSNAEITDCDLTCTKWCIRVVSDPSYFPMGGDAPLQKISDPSGPHHIRIARNVMRNADVGIAMDGVSQSIVEHNELLGSVLGGGAIYPSSAGSVYFGHNSAENHWSGDRESMTFDGTGGPSYYGPVASSSAGSTLVVLPEGAVGGGEAMLVLNGSGFGQVHAVAGYDEKSRTLTLTKPLAAALGSDAYVQLLAFQGQNIFHGNSFADNGAFQIWGSAFDSVFSGNVARRFGGFFSWGQFAGNASDTRLDPKGTVSSIAPNMRQLWLGNEVLDENGVRNYMASARHTERGARLRNVSASPAQPSVEVMGSFQFNGFSFGVEGSSMADRPADAPPINSFLVWRGNTVNSMGGFGLGTDVSITPGRRLESGNEQPRLVEVLLEGNAVHNSPMPFLLGSGVAGLVGINNNFDVPEIP